MVPTAGSKLITSQLEHTPKVPGMRRLITLTSQQTSEICRCPHFPASDSGCHVAGQVAVTPRFVFVPQALGQLLQVQPLAVASTPLGLFLCKTQAALGNLLSPVYPASPRPVGEALPCHVTGQSPSLFKAHRVNCYVAAVQWGPGGLRDAVSLLCVTCQPIFSLAQPSCGPGDASGERMILVGSRESL